MGPVGCQVVLKKIKLSSYFIDLNRPGLLNKGAFLFRGRLIRARVEILGPGYTLT